MKAIVQDTCGSPDVLELRRIDNPEIGERDRDHPLGKYMPPGTSFIARKLV